MHEVTARSRPWVKLFFPWTRPLKKGLNAVKGRVNFLQKKDPLFYGFRHIYPGIDPKARIWKALVLKIMIQ